MMIDVTDATFETEVLERSLQTPIVVDLWAPWCGPCKTLGPMIEKVVDETNGKVILAKVNVDENQGVSQAFRVQSIPAVYAVVDGQVLNGFTGAQPEAEIRAFVESLIPALDASAIDGLIAQGDEASLLQALDIDRFNEEAGIALASLWVDSSRGENAIELLQSLALTPAVQEALAAAQAGASADDEEMAKVEARLAELLVTVKEDDEARAEFVELLSSMVPDDPTTLDWRRKLTTRLY